MSEKPWTHISTDFITNLLLEQLTKVHKVHGVSSKKPKIILVTILETELISRKPKRIE